MRTELIQAYYQRAAVEHIIDHLYCGLFPRDGTGKTVSTLTAINYPIGCYGEVGHVLIVAPLRVADDVEHGMWYMGSICGLTMSKVVGTAKARQGAQGGTPTCTSSAAITCRGWCRSTGISSPSILPDVGAGRAVVVQELEDSAMEGAAHGAPLFDRVVGLTKRPRQTV